MSCFDEIPEKILPVFSSFDELHCKEETKLDQIKFHMKKIAFKGSKKATECTVENSYIKWCDVTNLWSRLITTWICIFYVQSVQCVCVYFTFVCVCKRDRCDRCVCICVCMHMCMYCIMKRGGGYISEETYFIPERCWFTMIDLQSTDFSPKPSWEIWFQGNVSGWLM